MATCIFYRNGRLSGRDNEVLARSKRQHYYKPRILGSKKNYGLKFTLHLAFFYCFTFYAGFPHWMAFGRWEGVRPSAPVGPFLRRPSLGRRRRRWHGNSRGHNCRTFSGYFFFTNGHYSYASPIRIGESGPRAKPARQPILQVRNRRGTRPSDQSGLVQVLYGTLQVKGTVHSRRGKGRLNV